MSYSEIKSQLHDLPQTWYPALLKHLVEECIEQKVFKQGRIHHFVRGLEACEPGDSFLLTQELCDWLDHQNITSDNIGAVRRQCFVPWDSLWNGIVRDETAARENRPTPTLSPHLQDPPTVSSGKPDEQQ